MGTLSKYQQVEDYIRKQISSGDLKVGDQIETEQQLCDKFNFSRMTVNKAITHLTEAGYLKRIQSKGTFVTAPHVSKPSASRSSFTEDMKRIGLTAGSQLISYEIKKGADLPHIKSLLHLGDDDMIHYFVRLRTGNDIPIAVSYTYISANIIPAIDVSSLNGSFYSYLKDIGISTQTSDLTLRAVLPTNEEKKLLHISNSAILKSSHVTFTHINNEDVPFEYVETDYNGDMFTYTNSGSQFSVQ